MKNLIGKKVRGFKFDTIGALCYIENMSEYDGVVGVIKEHYDKLYAYGVEFPDGESFAYPAGIIEQHIVEDSVSDTNEAIISAIVDAYFNGTSLPQIRESIRQAYTAIEAGVNAQLVEIKEERGKL